MKKPVLISTLLLTGAIYFGAMTFRGAIAATVTVKDANQDYQMKVLSDGSINVNGGGGSGGTVTQGPAGTDPWPVIFTPQTVSSTTITNVSTTMGSSVTLVAPNTNRIGLIVFDESATSCYVALASTASSTSFTFIIVPFQTYTMGSPVYQGAVSAYCNSGNMLITEF